MTASIVFKHEDIVGGEFTFSNNPPYQLNAATSFPEAQVLDVNGMEYFGTHGGLTLSSRFQRQPVKVDFNIAETIRDRRSMMELLSEASSFFMPMNDNLVANKFTMIVTTDDKNNSQYMMRHGAITVPFSAPLFHGLPTSVTGSIGFIFDDPLHYWVKGEGVTSVTLRAPSENKIQGEVWDAANGQTFNNALSVWSVATNTNIVSVNVVTTMRASVDIAVTGEIEDVKIMNDTNGSMWNWGGIVPAKKTLTVSDSGLVRDWDGKQIFNSIGSLTADRGINRFELTGKNTTDNTNVVLTIRGTF